MDGAAGVVTLSVWSRWLPDGSVSRAEPVLYTAAFPGTRGPYSPVFTLEGGTVFAINFGNEPFPVPPPANHLSLRRCVRALSAVALFSR